MKIYSQQIGYARRLELLVCILLLGIQAADAQIQLFVSPTGSDHYSGRTAHQAVATLHRAAYLARSLQTADQDVEVRILPGMFLLAEPLVLTADDSATPGQRVVWCAHDPEDRPRISGAQRILGPWREEGQGIVSTVVDVNSFRQLYINGRAAVTAREPEIGHWERPNGDRGYVGCQANVHWDGWNVNPGVVHLADTQDVTIKNCTFRNTTAAGLCLVRGTQRTLIEGNVFTEIGDTPIAVYTEKDRRPDEPNQCRDDVIRNNFVSGFGRHNYAAAGICVAVATRITVEHNEVTDGGYAGITYGYFSEPNSPAVGSRILSNHVHHVMNELDDGAGIYVFNTEFDQSHSTLLVERNFIHDVVRGPTAEANPVAGMYLDEGTSAVTMRQNVIRSVGNTIHLNTGGQHGCRPDRQVYEGNTDEEPKIEAQAGLEPPYRRLNPNLYKPEPTFETPVCLHHWPLDGDAKDIVGDCHGTLMGGAMFDTDQPAAGTAAVRLNGKHQWIEFSDVLLPDRFTLCLWLWLPANAYGEQAIFTMPGLRIYSAVGISDFKEQLRTETIDANGHNTAQTLNGVLPRGQWNHLVVTLDRRHEAQRVYVNGQDVTSTDHLGHRDWPARGPVWLGKYSDRQQDQWRDLDGRFDDVRIYRGHLRLGAIQAMAATHR